MNLFGYQRNSHTRKAMFRQVWIHALSLYNLSGRNGQPFLLINIMQNTDGVYNDELPLLFSAA